MTAQDRRDAQTTADSQSEGQRRELEAFGLHFPGHLTKRPSAREQLRDLLEHEDVATRVQALDPYALYTMITEVGLRDAAEIALLAKPEQIQRFFDLDCWRRDQFEDRRLTRWLKVYLQLEEKEFQDLYRELDPEVLPMYLKQHIQVWLADEHGAVPDEVPDDIDVVSSPDFAYYIAYPENEELALTCRKLIDKIYSDLGIMKGWAMLESTRWELESEMQETAYHFRSARLEGLGFRRTEEAIEVYSYLDPTRQRAALKELQPIAADRAALTTTGSDDAPSSFFGECTALLIAARGLNAIATLESQMITLNNLVASADSVEPGVRAALEASFARTASTLEIGLEFLSQRDPHRGAATLEVLPLKEIFKTGHAVTLKLAKQARDLTARNQISIIEGSPASLLEAAEQELIEALTGDQRPRRTTEERGWFRNQHDVEVAAQSLARIAIKELFFYGILRFEKAELAGAAFTPGLIVTPTGVTFSNLLATFVLREALSGKAELKPFSAEDISTGLDASAIESAFAPWLERALLPPQASGSTPLLKSFVCASRDAVIAEVAHLAEGAFDPRFVSAFLMVGAVEEPEGAGDA